MCTMEESMSEMKLTKAAEFLLALDRAGFNGGIAQKIINSKGNVLAKKMYDFVKGEIIDLYFGPAFRDFRFTVPLDYDHDSQLDTFARKTKDSSTTLSFDVNLSSKNFAKATTRLIPGKTYRVQLFPILEMVWGEYCIRFLKKKGAILVGGQGITLLQDKVPDEFKFPTMDGYVVSFDEEYDLWKDNYDCYNVPQIKYNSSIDSWKFSLHRFNIGLSGVGFLLCVSELPNEKTNK